MTASELAFLGLGLLLGAASGAALIVVLGTRSPRREIRVTVTRDALPRRSGTLSQDAFVTSRNQPARGGPADRRGLDRDLPTPDFARVGAIPMMYPDAPVVRVDSTPERPPLTAPQRTAVPFVAASVAVAQLVDALDPASATDGAATDELRTAPAGQTALERMLRGEHRAMLEVIDAVAGEDSLRRRDWELLLGGLVEAMAEMAVRESVIDFPMGTAFWDAFTVEQCRRIVSALGSMGFEYDGRAGWVEQHVPVYRDLSIALADIGVDPRRLRAWPNQAEIAALFTGARPAPEELLAAAGPDYGVEDMKALLGDRSSELAGLWIAWDEARLALLATAEAPRELPA